ncbi:MAG: alpha/beta hydrolase, partial [Solirubrobacterales bacterium]
YLERISREEGARTTVALYRTFLLRELPGNQIGKAMVDPFPIRTRLLMGERDPIAKGADLEGYESHAPEMTLEWVPGAGHFLPEEEPELVARQAQELAAFQGT